MRILIEGHPYKAPTVRDALVGFDFFENIKHEVVVNYVGYLYNPLINDCIFFLPKVLINEQGLVFKRLDPEHIIHVDKAEGLTEEERNFIYEFAVWIYRSLYVFNKQHPENEVVYHKQMSEANMYRRHISNTYLEVLLALIDFNRKNKNFFLTILKNIHSGHNKINWTRTIAKSTAIVERNVPIYLNPVNKKRQINFDEELLVIYFSILRYIKEKFGFPITFNIGYELITGSKFLNYINGFGSVRLRQIKYKYFSDTALNLWNLCYAFFEKSHKISVGSNMQEYLIAQNYNIVFEAIIDELIGDKKENLPHGLSDQRDGKRVDHIYSYRSLATTQDDPIYYIGDSKYYKVGSEVGKDSVYKQFTYARNVIQWNLDLFLDGHGGEKKSYRDEITEGYNIVPNFFISAKMNEKLSYISDDLHIRNTEKGELSYLSRQFENRLFDRDTLLVYHYDVNFLFIVSLYAQENEYRKAEWKDDVRERFRREIQYRLQKDYDFYAMTPKAGVVSKDFIRDHFQLMLGKVYKPYEDDRYFSLALDVDDPDGTNDSVLASLRNGFDIEKCKLGQDPSEVVTALPRTSLTSSKRGVLMVMMENYDSRSMNFIDAGKIGVAFRHTKSSLEIVQNSQNIGYILFHTRKDEGQHMFKVKSVSPVLSKKEVSRENIYCNFTTTEFYIIVDFESEEELLTDNIFSSRIPAASSIERYDAQFAWLNELM